MGGWRAQPGAGDERRCSWHRLAGPHPPPLDTGYCDRMSAAWTLRWRAREAQRAAKRFRCLWQLRRRVPELARRGICRMFSPTRPARTIR